MFDDVERRRFLVEPPRKNAAPTLVRLLDVDLHERAGQLLLFPRRGRLASAQANDDILPSRRLAGMERDVLDDPVALVEDAKHGDALRHRRNAALSIGGRGRLPGARRDRVLLLGTLPARNKRGGDQQGRNGSTHFYSGIQGS
jgi:hypothetical protein